MEPQSSTNPQQGSPYPPIGSPVQPSAQAQYYPPAELSQPSQPAQSSQYQPQAQYQHSPTHVNHAPYIMPASNYNPAPRVRDSQLTFGPQVLYCNRCNGQVVSKIQETSGRFVFYNVIGMCLRGACLCAFVPFLVPACRDVEHLCMNCNNHLGTKRLL